MSNQPTMQDVARSCGVSVATVSRVFTGKVDSVTPQTRERVERAAKSLGYTPSEIGRSLRLARTRVVMLLVPDITNDFCADVAISLERSLSAIGLSMVLANTAENAEQQDRFLAEAEGLRAHAVVLLGAIDTPKLRDLAKTRANIIFVNRRPPADIDAPYVGIDNEAAGFEVGQYFMEKAYRPCGVIHGPLQYSASAERLAGFERALSQDASDDSQVVRIQSSLTMESGYRHGLELLSKRPPIRAVFCGNDMIAYGIHRAAEGKRIRIPEEFAIFGFDDNRINEWVAPWLSTVKVPALDFGPATASMLNPERRSEEPLDDIVLPFSLRIRKSA